MKKKRYIILIFPVIFPVVLTIIFIISKNINNNKNIETPIEIINCKLNNKTYSFDVYFDSDNLVYKTGTNESLNEPFIYKTEEEIKNVITSIYENKGAICTTYSNYNIEIDF